MPYCARCGTQMAVDVAACPNCGQPQGQWVTPATTPVAPQAPAARPTDGQAVAALVSGIVGLTFCPFIGSIVAVILGTNARRRLIADPTLEGASLARVAVILGWIGIGLGLVGFLIPIMLAAIGGFGP